jgi:hypothetical protein
MSDDTSTRVRCAIDGDAEAVEGVVARISPLLMVQARFRLGPKLRKHYDELPD